MKSAKLIVAFVIIQMFTGLVAANPAAGAILKQTLWSAGGIIFENEVIDDAGEFFDENDIYTRGALYEPHFLKSTVMITSSAMILNIIGTKRMMMGG